MSKFVLSVLFPLVSVVLTVAPQSISARELGKSVEEHWADTSLEFGWLSKLLSIENCYGDAKLLAGCFAAVNAVLEADPNPDHHWTFVSRERAARMSNATDLIKNFGESRIVAFQPRGEVSSFAELKSRMFETAEQQRKDIESLYEQMAELSPVDFSVVLDWLIKEVLPSIPVGKVASVTAGALNAFLQVTQDLHTIVISEGEWKARLLGSAAGGPRVGIGAQFSIIDTKILVKSVEIGGPALLGGLRAGDILLAINGRSVTPKEFVSITQNLLENRVNALVRLTVGRHGKEVVLPIRQKVLNDSNVIFRRIGQSAVGYIRIASFLRKSTCKDVEAAVFRLLQQRVRGWVLDLRGNPGGFLREATCVAGIFLKQGSLVYSAKTLDGSSSVPTDGPTSTESGPMTDLPVVTLIDAGSASASEVVAGALRDHGRSVLVGVRSFGKATAQGIATDRTGRYFNFGVDGLVYLQTGARYFLPSGNTPQGPGIEPDFEAYPVRYPTDEEKVAIREEDLPYTLPAIPAVTPRSPFPNELAVRACVQASVERAISDKGRDLMLDEGLKVLRCLQRY